MKVLRYVATACSRGPNGVPRAAGRALHNESPMLGDDRRHLRQLDPLGDADAFGGKIAVQGSTAARAAVGPMLDDRVGIVAHHPAMVLVGPRARVWPRRAWIARAAPCARSLAASRTCARSSLDAAAAAPARSVPRGSIAQDRCDPSIEGISETRPAQGGEFLMCGCIIVACAHNQTRHAVLCKNGGSNGQS